jgi:hypothetical protein
MIANTVVPPYDRSCHFVHISWTNSKTTIGRTSRSEAEEDKQNQEGKRREEEWTVSISLLNAVIQLAIIS